MIFLYHETAKDGECRKRTVGTKMISNAFLREEKKQIQSLWLVNYADTNTNTFPVKSPTGVSDDCNIVIINDLLWLNYCYKYLSIVNFSAVIAVGAGNVLYSVLRIIHNVFQMRNSHGTAIGDAQAWLPIAGPPLRDFPIRKTLWMMGLLAAVNRVVHQRLAAAEWRGRLGILLNNYYCCSFLTVLWGAVGLIVSNRM